MADVRIAIENSLGKEGGFSNNKNDSGGPTRFGITEVVARANGYAGPMESMPIEVAVKIYRLKYWRQAWDELRSQKIANELFDTRVLSGNISDVIAQAVCNSFNSGGKLFPNMLVDGCAGPSTVKAFNILIDRGDEAVVLKALNGVQATWFVMCSAGDKARDAFLQTLRETANPSSEKNEDFMRGWIDKRALKKE